MKESRNRTQNTFTKAKRLASILDCGVSTVYHLAKRGEIPSISLGRHGVRFSIEDVLRAMRRKL